MRPIAIAFGSEEPHSGVHFDADSATAIRCVDDVIRTHPELSWKDLPTPDGGKMAIGVMSHNKLTGDLLFMFAMERCTSPLHEHLGNGVPYLEYNILIGGEMHDLDDSGKRVIMRAGDTLKHVGGAGRVHAPVTPTFCWGISHQPAGSRLIQK